LSWLEFPKASNFNFTPNGFEILYKDKDGNLMPFLGYEYVEKVGGSSTPTEEESTNEEVSKFIEKIKTLFKQGNQWHFINETVNGHTVKIKFFVGVKEVDVQIMSIDNLGTSLGGNYMGKRDTQNKMIELFNNKLK
jgi:hypothetical protein